MERLSNEVTVDGVGDGLTDSFLSQNLMVEIKGQPVDRTNSWPLISTNPLDVTRLGHERHHVNLTPLHTQEKTVIVRVDLNDDLV